LPYYTIRQGVEMKRDIRGIRRSGPFLSLRANTHSNEYLHEAQISFLVVGTDEWWWTAYCLADTFFGSEIEMALYHERQYDAPCGGLQHVYLPAWNPREYFLLVLSRRLTQVTKEWSNIVNTLESRLQYHV
jgi:hypothetical protein